MSAFIGPVLRLSSDSDAKTEESQAYGPQLPPKRQDQTQNSTSERYVGPVLPPGMLVQLNNESDSDSDDIIGPQLPTDVSTKNSSDVYADIEKRALKMKQKLSGKVDGGKPEREEWMTVLPPEMSKNFGLGPRSFQRKSSTRNSDRSGWTETPSTSQTKEKTESKRKHDEDSVKKRAKEKYDDDMSKTVEKHHKKSKRGESLYDIHTKSRKIKRKTVAVLRNEGRSTEIRI